MFVNKNESLKYFKSLKVKPVNIIKATHLHDIPEMFHIFAFSVDDLVNHIGAGLVLVEHGDPARVGAAHERRVRQDGLLFLIQILVHSKLGTRTDYTR